jgi:hypothetical protein
MLCCKIISIIERLLNSNCAFCKILSGGSFDMSSLASMFQTQVVQSEARIKQFISAGEREDMISPSPAYRGADVIKKLQESGNYFDCTAEILGGGQSVVPEGVTLDSSSEAILNISLYPYLFPIFDGAGLVLMNSEKVKWIQFRLDGIKEKDSAKFDLMPDFAACDPSLYTPEDAYETEKPLLIAARMKNLDSRFPIIYGGPYWSARDGIDVVFETKVNYGTDGLGELLNYQAHICKNMENHTSKGVYMWRAGFMLVRVKHGHAESIKKSLWHTPGSYALFSNFVTSSDEYPSWKVALKCLCHKRGLRLVDHGFLGRGGRGLVFEVTEGAAAEATESKGGDDHVNAEDTPRFALKIVVGSEKSEELQLEYDVIRTRLQSCTGSKTLPIVSLPLNHEGCIPPAEEAVIRITNIFENNLSLGTVPAAAYLMESVGKSAPCKSKDDRFAIFWTLCVLHRDGIVHGDPRVQNIIQSNGRLLWIDFMACHLADSSVAYKQDAIKLLRSMYHLREDILSSSVENLVKNYSLVQDEASIKELLSQFEG